MRLLILALTFVLASFVPAQAQVTQGFVQPDPIGNPTWTDLGAR